MRPLIAVLVALALVVTPAQALASSPEAPPSASISPPSNPTISAFYTTDPQYCGQTGEVRPPRVVEYPDHARLLVYYVEFAGAVPDTTRYHVEYYRKGKLARPYLQHTFRTESGTMMNGCGPDPVGFADGDYRLDLVVDGVRVRSTTFRVGSTHRTVTVPRQGAVVIPVLYTADFHSYETWDQQTPPPPVRRFTSVPSRIGYYFEYTNAVSGSTTVLMVLHYPSGSLDQGCPVTVLPSISRSQFNWCTMPAGLTVGTYRLDLEAEGTVRASTTFFVG